MTISVCRLALTSIALLISVAACGHQNSQTFKPVDGFPLPQESCDNTPVETRIYTYVSGQRAEEDGYKVTPDKPLRLNLPSFFYAFAPNHNGGAQIQIGLSLVYPSAQALATSGLCANPSDLSAQSRRVIVVLYSNMLSGIEPFHAGDPPIDESNIALIKHEKFGSPINIGGFKYFPFERPAWADWTKRYSANGGTDPLYLSSYYGVPSRGKLSDIKIIVCSPLDKNCEIIAQYRTTLISLSFPKRYLADSESFVAKVLTLIRKADLDAN